MNRNLKIIMSSGIVLVLFIFLTKIALSSTAWETNSNWSEDMDGLVDSLFDKHVLSLETLGILLTAAMIGAMVLARPLGRQLDSANYTKATSKELAESQAVSEVEAES